MDKPNDQNDQGNSTNTDVKPSESSDKSFPFKPLDREEGEVKKSTQTDSADSNSAKSKHEEITISTQQTPAPISQTQKEPSNSQPQVNNYQKQPAQPAKNYTPLVYGLVGVLFIILGFSGGYFGYKYLPKLITSSADTTNPSATTNTNITSPQNNNATVSDVSSWPSYTNTKYKFTIKYPDTWYAKNINDPAAANVTFYSYDPSKSSSTGYKVDLVVQSSNNQTLQDWVSANSSTTGNTSNAVVPLKIGSIDAIQQTASSNSINTYLLDSDQVITINYSATDNFSAGQTIYDQIINSITM